MDLLTIAMITVLADWSQTRHIAESDSYRETNFILGSQPTRSNVDMYFAASIGAVYSTKYISNKRARNAVQVGVIVNQLTYIAQNRKIGIKWSF